MRLNIIIILILLVSCGYENGDLDRGLECFDGCEKKLTPEPSPTPKIGGCNVKSASNGAIVTCVDGDGNETNTIIMNGTNGTNGKDAPPTAYTFIEVIDPCGKQASFDEVLFKTASGQYVAYTKIKGGFLYILNDNATYDTADGTRCRFTISSGEITNEYNY